jgi:hypothetical protein
VLEETYLNSRTSTSPLIGIEITNNPKCIYEFSFPGFFTQREKREPQRTLRKERPLFKLPEKLFLEKY